MDWQYLERYIQKLEMIKELENRNLLHSEVSIKFQELIVAEILNTLGHPTLPTKFDICVVCAMEEEARTFLQAVSEYCHVSFEKVFNKHLGFAYYHTCIHNNSNEPLTIQVSWLPDKCLIETAIYLQPFLKMFTPRFVAMTGICAGFKKKTALGDIIVADRAYFYDGGKFQFDQAGQRLHLLDADVYQINPKLKHALRMFELWRHAAAQLPHPAGKSVQQLARHIGPIASSAAVRSDHPFEEGQLLDRNTVALDMEGAAFYRTLAGFPGMLGLLVKGISDYADGDKDDSYHHYAALASALYLLRAPA